MIYKYNIIINYNKSHYQLLIPTWEDWSSPDSVGRTTQIQACDLVHFGALQLMEVPPEFFEEFFQDGRAVDDGSGELPKNGDA